MVGSSLANRGREMRDDITLQQRRAASLKGEKARAKKFAGDLEGKMAELKVQNQQATEELAKAKGEWDAVAN